MRTLIWWLGGMACLIGAAAAQAMPIDPIILTVDGKSYVTSASAPVVISPLLRLVLAPESSMSNCRRGNGLPLPAGIFRLEYSLLGDAINANNMTISFAPTQLTFATSSGDVICDGEANGGQTGFGRIFRDSFG